MTAFDLELVGGPWLRRLGRRRAGFDDLPWDRAGDGMSPEDLEGARAGWTRSAFSEYASAAAFAEIASCLLAAGAPLDFVAAAGDFVADEVLHAELSARVAAAMGGAVVLEVDLERLVRPPEAATPLLRAAELLVRTSCVGETLTVPVLKAAAARSRSSLMEAVLARIVRDESHHAQLGPWFLDWAAPRLRDADRAHLGRVAGEALRAFAPFAAEGLLDPATGDARFAEAVARQVVGALAIRGIDVPTEDVAWVPDARAQPALQGA